MFPPSGRRGRVPRGSGLFGLLLNFVGLFRWLFGRLFYFRRFLARFLFGYLHEAETQLSQRVFDQPLLFKL